MFLFLFLKYLLILILNSKQINASDNECKLVNVRIWESTSLGHPLPPHRIKTTGVVNLAMIFVDYWDAQALFLTESSTYLFQLYASINVDWFSRVSYGLLKLQITPHLHWFRLSKLSSEYGDVSVSYEAQRKFISDVLRIAEHEGNLDFSFADVILIVSNPNASAISRSATFASSPGLGVLSSRSGKEFLNVMTIGADFHTFNAYILAHELGHTFGLPDLYSYMSMSNLNQYEYVGEWSIMGSLNGAETREYFGWEKWLLNWLKDTQVTCMLAKITNRNYFINLTPLEVNNFNDIKLAVVKVSETLALAIESRHLNRSDSNIGIVVYLIDTLVSTGHGGIRVLNAGMDKDKIKSILTSPGQMLSFMDVTVKYVYRNFDTISLEILIK